MVTDEQLRKRLQEVLPTVDLQTTTVKMLRKQLEDEFEVELTERKDIIRQEVDKFLAADGGVKEEDINEEMMDEEQEESEEEEKTAAKGKRGRGLGSRLSEEMQAFLGAESMSRPQVVKKIWEYIKANNLQNPQNRREIILDDKLKTLFTPPVNIFSMNKQLSRHVKTDDSQDGGAAPSKPSKPRAKKPTKAKAADGAGGGKSNSGFNKPLQLSPQLAEFVGQQTMARGELTKTFWAYFKANDLQDPTDKRTILADDKLQAMFKVKKFTGFSLAKLLTPHLSKAVDAGPALDDVKEEDVKEEA